jgi:hypothetical protein
VSANFAHAVCQGDCNEDGVVAVNELITAVNVALGNAAIDACGAADADADGSIAVNELVGAVSRLLTGCPPEATRTSTELVAPTLTPIPESTATASASATASATAPDTATPTMTPPPTLTHTPTPAGTATATGTGTATGTASATATETPTLTQTPSSTPTITETPTPPCAAGCLAAEADPFSILNRVNPGTPAPGQVAPPENSLRAAEALPFSVLNRIIPTLQELRAATAEWLPWNAEGEED